MIIEDLSYDYQRLVVILIRLMPINADLSYHFYKVIHKYIRVIRTVLRIIRIMYDRHNIIVLFIQIQYDSS